MRITEAIAEIRKEQKADIASMQFFFFTKFPDTIKALKKIDYETFQPKRRKGFNLVKRESKKYGHVYYARYSHNGKMLPTKFCMHTSDEAAAERNALERKSRLIEQFLTRQDGRMYKILKSFYKLEHKHRSDNCRRLYHLIIINKFIPFLRQEKIASFDQIKTPTLNKFQDSLLERGLKPQTVNRIFKAVRPVFAYLERKEMLVENPCNRLKGLYVSDKDIKARGCYDLEKPKGVFNRRWKDELSCLLTLLIYTTGLRNSEIKSIKMTDIIKIDGCYYLKVNKSKTPSGKREVPLHDFVYKKLKAWAMKNNKDLFDVCTETAFKRANKELAKMLKVDEKTLEEEKITFYSGRHFWKTLMSEEGLGDKIEEIWMGHKVKSDVKELYNHRNKIGRKRLEKKARKLFSILDECIFKTKQ